MHFLCIAVLFLSAVAAHVSIFFDDENSDYEGEVLCFKLVIQIVFCSH